MIFHLRSLLLGRSVEIHALSRPWYQDPGEVVSAERVSHRKKTIHQ